MAQKANRHVHLRANKKKKRRLTFTFLSRKKRPYLPALHQETPRIKVRFPFFPKQRLVRSQRHPSSLLRADCGHEWNFRGFVTFPRQDDAEISRERKRENPSGGALLREIVQQSRCKKHQRGVGPRHKAFADSVCPSHQKWMAPPRNGIQYSRGTRNILVSPPEIEITLPPPPSSPPLRSPTSFHLAHDHFDKASSRRNEDGSLLLLNAY